MKRTLSTGLLAFALLGVAGGAAAAPWATDAAVGPNEVDVTIQIACPAAGFVCSQVDGYSDTQTSTLTGGATFLLDETNAQIQFDMDDTQDVGSGPQDTYLTMAGTDLTFAGIPFAGIPEIINLFVFSVTSPVIDVPGLDIGTPGDYAFSTTLDYASVSETTGDLEFILPDIVLSPTAVVVSGTFRVLGDIDTDGMVEYEIRDIAATLALQTNGTIGGEAVTIDVTADLTANLSGEVMGPPPEEVPALGTIATGVLMAGLVGLGVRAQRGRERAKS